MSIDFSNLSDAQIGSILALVSSDEVREARNRLSLEGVSNTVTVEPFTITCDGGTGSISKRTTRVPTTNVLSLEAIALAWHLLGFQRENLASFLEEADRVARLKRGDKGAYSAALEQVSNALPDRADGTAYDLRDDVKELKAELAAGLSPVERAGVSKWNITGKVEVKIFCPASGSRGWGFSRKKSQDYII